MNKTKRKKLENMQQSERYVNAADAVDALDGALQYMVDAIEYINNATEY